MKNLFAILIMLVLFSPQAFTQDTGPPRGQIVPPLPRYETPERLTVNKQVSLPNPMKITQEHTSIMIVLHDRNYYYPVLTGKIETSAIDQLYINPDPLGQVLHYTTIGRLVWFNMPTR